jgi:glutamine amidotransferase
VRFVVADIGLSNLWSARKALEALGHEVEPAGDAAAVRSARALVLPGVGAFAEAARRLSSSGIGDAIRFAVERGTPALGICLGMQLLFESSEEGGESRGLGLLPGRVRRLRGGAPVPHVGWNRVEPTDAGRGLFPRAGDFYFVHSYVAEPGAGTTVLAECVHGETFPAAVARGRCLGFQFHPEKSGEAGLALLGAALARMTEDAAA